MRENNVLSYIIGDHLGSTSIVTDASGNVIAQQKYKAWGEVRYESGTNPSEYGYTGQYSYTDDFGLMYYGARWYDSSLGRFAQADTIIPASQGVQGYDRYAYTNNNPINNTDPTGHVCFPKPGSKSACSIKPPSNAGSSGVNTTSTPTVTSPSSSQQPTGVFGVCGSQGANNMFAQGPNCILITDTNDSVVHLSGLADLNLPSGFDLIPVRYPQSNNLNWNEAKTQQSQDIAELAKNYPSVILICYSAGVDSCLFASNSISGLNTIVLIGGPYGGYDGSESNFVSSDELFSQIEKLSEGGVNILMIDDANVWADDYEPDVANGKFQIINAPDHYVVGANATFFQEVIWDWIPNPDFLFP